MQTFTCTTAELAAPEFLRLLAIATAKENQRLQDQDYEYWAAHFARKDKLHAARKALAICNRLKPSPTKARHSARIFRTLNQLRAVA